MRQPGVQSVAPPGILDGFAPTRSPKPWQIEAEGMLDAVEAWAEGVEMFREMGIIGGGISNRRLDAVLVPVSTAAHCLARGDKFGLIGVEIKRTRSDFLKGLRESKPSVSTGWKPGLSQFEEYRVQLLGLYIVTLKGACKPSEIPDGLGDLVIEKQESPPEYRCFCRRHPRYDGPEPTNSQMLHIMFRMRGVWKERIELLKSEHEDATRFLKRKRGRVLE